MLTRRLRESAGTRAAFTIRADYFVREHVVETVQGSGLEMTFRGWTYSLQDGARLTTPHTAAGTEAFAALLARLSRSPSDADWRLTAPTGRAIILWKAVSATRAERATVEMQGWCSRHMSGEALEEVVLEVFRQILRNPDVTPESDFFELGGDSNMAIDALSEISEHAGVDVDMAAIFFYPTPHELSAALAGAVQE